MFLVHIKNTWDKMHRINQISLPPSFRIWASSYWSSLVLCVNKQPANRFPVLTFSFSHAILNTEYQTTDH